ncbi:MAG: DUF7528 family protein [Halanaeroarchaeum sp.]
MTVESDGGTIVLAADDDTIEIPRGEVSRLAEALEAASTARQTFFRTACEHRADGRYVVERRGADSTGNSTVFDSFDAAKRLFDRLPDRFAADALERAGYTGSRRHMLVRHFAEHPEFPCELASRNPLEARKTDPED